MITEALISIVAFGGLIVGILLSRFCAEEIKPGSKYFRPLKIAVILLLGVGLFAKSYEYYSFFIIGCLAGYVFRSTYFFLGVAMASVVGVSLKMVMLVSSLVFIFGLPYGSMLKSWKREAALSAFFFFIPFALYLADFNMAQFLAFAAGGILINPFADAIENFINVRSLYKQD